MAIHHLTPPVRGGERPRLPSTQIGPVTQAIRAMRGAAPTGTVTVSVLPTTDAAIAAIREGVMRFLADRIERDIALLDALDGDCDLEEDDPAGGDICDEPHDPEEDGCEAEDAGLAFCSFDGSTYRSEFRRRRT